MGSRNVIRTPTTDISGSAPAAIIRLSTPYTNLQSGLIVLFFPFYPLSALISHYTPLLELPLIELPYSITSRTMFPSYHPSLIRPPNLSPLPSLPLHFLNSSLHLISLALPLSPKLPPFHSSPWHLPYIAPSLLPTKLPDQISLSPQL